MFFNHNYCLLVGKKDVYMEYINFENINDITLKLINHQASNEQIEEYANLCRSLLQQARVETDNAVESIARWNKIRPNR